MTNLPPEVKAQVTAMQARIRALAAENRHIRERVEGKQTARAAQAPLRQKLYARTLERYQQEAPGGPGVQHCPQCGEFMAGEGGHTCDPVKADEHRFLVRTTLDAPKATTGELTPQEITAWAGLQNYMRKTERPKEKTDEEARLPRVLAYQKQAVRDKQIRGALQAAYDLESQTSPENFWCDGELPNTPENQARYVALSREHAQAESLARLRLNELTPGDLRTVLNELPDDLREEAIALGFRWAPEPAHWADAARQIGKVAASDLREAFGKPNHPNNYVAAEGEYYAGVGEPFFIRPEVETGLRKYLNGLGLTDVEIGPYLDDIEWEHKVEWGRSTVAVEDWAPAGDYEDFDALATRLRADLDEQYRERFQDELHKCAVCGRFIGADGSGHDERAHQPKAAEAIPPHTWERVYKNGRWQTPGDARPESLWPQEEIRLGKERQARLQAGQAAQAPTSESLPLPFDHREWRQHWRQHLTPGTRVVLANGRHAAIETLNTRHNDPEELESITVVTDNGARLAVAAHEIGGSAFALCLEGAPAAGVVPDPKLNEGFITPEGLLEQIRAQQSIAARYKGMVHTAKGEGKAYYRNLAQKNAEAGKEAEAAFVNWAQQYPAEARRVLEAQRQTGRAWEQKQAEELLTQMPEAGVTKCAVCGRFIGADGSGHDQRAHEQAANAIPEWAKEDFERYRPDSPNQAYARAYARWWDRYGRYGADNPPDEPKELTLLATSGIRERIQAAWQATQNPAVDPSEETLAERQARHAAADVLWREKQDAAVAWQYLTVKNGGMARKSELDAWLRQRYGLEPIDARAISNAVDSRLDFETGGPTGVRWKGQMPEPQELPPAPEVALLRELCAAQNLNLQGSTFQEMVFSPAQLAHLRALRLERIQSPVAQTLWKAIQAARVNLRSATPQSVTLLPDEQRALHDAVFPPAGDPARIDTTCANCNHQWQRRVEEPIRCPQCGAARVANEQDGMEATITPTPQGWRVMLIDSDSQSALPTMRFFSTPEAATQWATSIVNGQEPESASPTPAPIQPAPIPPTIIDRPAQIKRAKDLYAGGGMGDLFRGILKAAIEHAEQGNYADLDEYYPRLQKEADWRKLDDATSLDYQNRVKALMQAEGIPQGEAGKRVWATMPRRHYRCGKCGHTFEPVAGNDPSPSRCPACRADIVALELVAENTPQPAAEPLSPPAKKTYHFPSKAAATKWVNENRAALAGGTIEQPYTNAADKHLTVVTFTPHADIPITPPPGQWYIDADDKPAWREMDADHSGYRGPYTPTEISELLGLTPAELRAARKAQATSASGPRHCPNCGEFMAAEGGHVCDPAARTRQMYRLLDEGRVDEALENYRTDPAAADPQITRADFVRMGEERRARLQAEQAAPSKEPAKPTKAKPGYRLSREFDPVNDIEPADPETATEWYKRSVAALEYLQQRFPPPPPPSKPSPHRFDMPTPGGDMKGSLMMLTNKRYSDGEAVSSVLWRMIDDGYTEMTGTYAVNPATGARVNLRREYVADGYRGMLLAHQAAQTPPATMTMEEPAPPAADDDAAAIFEQVRAMQAQLAELQAENARMAALTAQLDAEEGGKG